MCRHLGWTGAPRTLAALVLDPPHGLLRQSYAPRLQSHGLVNADGFGAGWYVPQARTEPVRYRRSVPIWTDASFASLAPTVASGRVVAAVRSASIGMPIEETATAPFTRGRYLFSHNGRVDAAGLRGRLPPSAAAESPCDSAVLAALLWHRLGEPAAPLPDAVLPDVVARVVLEAAECVPPGREQATVNVLATDGAAMCATAWGETLYLRREPDGVLIASEPGDAGAGWEQVPDRSLVVATPSSVAVTPLEGTSSPGGPRGPGGPGGPGGPDVPPRPRGGPVTPTPIARPTPSRASTARPADMLFVLDRHLTEADRAAALAADVRAGLCAAPKELPPKWFYDGEGSRLFEAITRLPEYYPTRRERAILRAHAAEIAELTRAETLVELGSGTSEKTRLLLDALTARGCLTGIVPFDVDDTVLAAAGAQIAADYPGVLVHAVVGDFQHHVDLLPTGGRRLIVFLGGTIGNLLPPERHRLLAGLRAGAGPHDALVLGTDLVKDPRRLVAAYDDAAGVTAAFNRNVLAVINRELDGNLDPAAFRHVAVWDADEEWIEMRLQSAANQQARVGALELAVAFERGEQMRTEISAKFRRDGVAAELAGAGWRMSRWWTDPAGDFAVSLSLPADTASADTASAG